MSSYKPASGNKTIGTNTPIMDTKTNTYVGLKVEKITKQKIVLKMMEVI